jgi:hypothetical protein
MLSANEECMTRPPKSESARAPRSLTVASCIGLVKRAPDAAKSFVSVKAAAAFRDAPLQETRHGN